MIDSRKLIGLCVLGALAIAGTAQANTPINRRVDPSDIADTDHVSRAITALKSESVVNDVLYKSGDGADWTIDVTNDNGIYAKHVCEVLKEYGVQSNDTVVRVTNVGMVVKTLQDFRKSNLMVRCGDSASHIEFISNVR